MPHAPETTTPKPDAPRADREPRRAAQVLGQSRDAARLARLREEGARRYREMLDETETLSHAEACGLLGLTSYELVELRGRRGVSWLPAPRANAYPAWQFIGGRVVEGLPEVLAALGDLPAVMRHQWLCSPCSALVDEVPATVLLAGRVDDVVRAARTAGQQGAS